MLHLTTDIVTGGFTKLMFILIVLVLWLLALIFLSNKFRKEGRIPQQRIFSIFLIIWACLSVAYYDVWLYTGGILEQYEAAWYTYLPAVFFSVCAGLGTYYLMMTFGKLKELQQKKRTESSKDTKTAQKKTGSKNKSSKKN